jgi:hypothetical protein
MLVGRENIAEVCTIDDVLQRGKDPDPDVGAPFGGDKPTRLVSSLVGSPEQQCSASRARCAATS